MTGKRIKVEDHAQIKVLRQEGYSIRQIAIRLKLARSSVARSVNNFKSTGRYGYEKPKGRPKCTTKRMDDAIILSAKKSEKHPKPFTLLYRKIQLLLVHFPAKGPFAEGYFVLI